MSSKGGRPMLEDVVRYANQRINYAATEKKQAQEKDETGNPSHRVKAARDLFSARCFKGGGLGNHAGDAIGLMWLLGKLDMPDMDETRLLDAARCWWHGRGQFFGDMGFKTGGFERASRTSGRSTKLSRAERDFKKYASLLLDADEYDRDCLESLMETTLDGDFPSWVSRIIQTELLRYVRFPLAWLAGDEDYAKLEAAKRALRRMAGVEAVKKEAA